MKYIIRYNESKDRSSLEDIFRNCQNCFAEMIDDGHVSVEHDSSDIFIYFECNSNLETPSDFKDYLKLKKNELDILEDLNVGLLRLRDIYNNINIFFDESDGYLTFKINNKAIEKGSFYTKVGKDEILIDSKSIKQILKIDNSVQISIWDSGRYQSMSFDFGNEMIFLKHMYRDYVNRRNELANPFDNSTIEDALIICPELMKQYQKMGKSIDELEIEGSKLFTDIIAISNGNDRVTHGSNGKVTREFWGFSLKLNDKFNYDIK